MKRKRSYLGQAKVKSRCVSKRTRVDSSSGSETATVTQTPVTPESNPTVVAQKEIDTTDAYINSRLIEFQQSMEQRMATLQAQLNTTLLGLENRIIMLINQRTSPPSDLEDILNKY